MDCYILVQARVRAHHFIPTACFEAWCSLFFQRLFLLSLLFWRFVRWCYPLRLCPRLFYAICFVSLGCALFKLTSLLGLFGRNGGGRCDV